MLYLFSLSEIWKKISEGVVNQFVSGLSAGIPTLVVALLIFLIGWSAARLIRRLLTKLLKTVGVDRFAEQLNDIDMLQNSGTRIQLSSVIAQSVYVVLMLIVTIATTDVLNVAVISQMMRDLFNYLPSLFTAALILVLGLFLADLLRKVALTTAQSLGMPSAKMMASIVFYFIFISVAISALGQAQLNTGFISSNLTVIIGAIALAFAVGYGLASRDLVANYLAGQYNNNKVRVGDDVRIAGVRGKVVLIDATTMVLQTTDRAIVVPLSKMTTERIEIFYPDAQEEGLLEPGEKD